MIRHDYKDARHSITEREKFYRQVLTRLPAHYVLISTCDRVELYEDDDQKPYYPDKKTVFHLFRLAAGLESPLLGENQILHQVKTAYLFSLARGKVSKYLNMMFQAALHTGKRVRAETGISKGAPSHSLAAVELIKKLGIDLKKCRITIIGINNLNKTILRYLMKKGAGMILVGNKTFDKANELARQMNCAAFPLSELRQTLKETDILISATSAPHLIVHEDHFPRNKKMLIIDLAVPRDVDERIANRPGIDLYNISDIERMAEQNISQRKNEIQKADNMIFESAEIFLNEIKKRT